MTKTTNTETEKSSLEDDLLFLVAAQTAQKEVAKIKARNPHLSEEALIELEVDKTFRIYERLKNWHEGQTSLPVFFSQGATQ